MKKLLWARLCTELEIGKQLAALKVKFKFQKELDRSITWKDYVWHEHRLTENHANEMILAYKWFKKRKLNPLDIQGVPNRRELIATLKDKNWKDKLEHFKSLL